MGRHWEESSRQHLPALSRQVVQRGVLIPKAQSGGLMGGVGRGFPCTQECIAGSKAGVAPLPHTWCRAVPHPQPFHPTSSFPSPLIISASEQPGQMDTMTRSLDRASCVSQARREGRSMRGRWEGGEVPQLKLQADGGGAGSQWLPALQ